MTPIDRAISIMSSQQALADAISTPARPITQSHVSYWKRTGRLPAEYVLSVEAATGISRHELRPDLYPEEE